MFRFDHTRQSMTAQDTSRLRIGPARQEQICVLSFWKILCLATRVTNLSLPTILSLCKEIATTHSGYNISLFNKTSRECRNDSTPWFYGRSSFSPIPVRYRYLRWFSVELVQGDSLNFPIHLSPKQWLNGKNTEKYVELKTHADFI